MKTSILLGAVLSLSAPAFAKVERVVVFADRAEVTRVEEARCDKGAGLAVFANLPDAVDERTLRGEVESPAVTVGVSSKKVNLEEDLDDRVKGLRKEQQEINDELARLQRLDQDANARLSTVMGYGQYFQALAREELRSPTPDVSRWDQLLGLMRSEGESDSIARITRNAERRKLARKAERVAARLARLQPAAAPAHLEASVAVQCGGKTRVPVRLSYVVPGATWSPEYDLSFSSKTKTGAGEVTLTVAGVIRQASGEDWDDAEIWLSTAKPRLGGEAPVPNPIYVNGWPDSSDKTLVQAQETRAKDLKLGDKTRQTGAKSAELDDGGKAFVLKLPNRVTVRADGRPYWFPVDERKSKATSTLVAVPKLAPYVFHAAKFDNPAPYPLLAGVVHVTRNQTYVGDVATEYRAPGEPLEISLGVDEEIRVERKDLLEKKRAAGLFSGTQHIDHAYRVLVENRARSEVEIEVREQIPVSKIEDVRVELDKQKTAAGYTLDEKRGHLTWRVKLGKGAKLERDLVFTIHLPKDWAVN